MDRSKQYELISYVVPFALFVVILIFLPLIKERARFFIVDRVSGTRHVRRRRNQPADEANNVDRKIEMYLYVELEDDIKSTTCNRFISYFMTASILAVVLTIIFESCVLSTQGVIIGERCPDFPAECFSSIASFNCTPGYVVNSSVVEQTAWCFAWVYKYQSARDVIDAIGVSGGLLGIISCIVPLVFNISAYEDKPCKAFFWIWLPVLPLLALFLVKQYVSPLSMSILAQTSLIVIFVLSSGAWLWAFLWMYKRKKGHYPWDRCCAAGITQEPVNEN